MAITYEWKITALKKAPSLDGLSDVITNINFEYKGTDENGNEAVFNGACPIAAPDAENFTDLADLKEADVVEWAKAHHPTDHMNHIIEGKIAEIVTPKNVAVDSMPWEPVVEEGAAEGVTTTEENTEEDDSSEE